MKEKVNTNNDKISIADEEGFRQFYDKYRSKIYTVALRLSNNQNIAEDVVQDTFLKIWIKRLEIEHIDHVESYLYAIARNSILNLMRKKERYKEYALQESRRAILTVFPEADFRLQEKEFEAILNEAIAKLPEKQKQAYILTKEQFLKREQAAQVLNVSPETIKSNLDKAMKSIRAYCMLHLQELPIVLVLHFFSKYF